MSILSGFLKVKRRRLTDEGYITQSEWTSASTVEHADGKTSEEKIQEIEDEKINYTDVINAYETAVAVTDTQTPVGCGVIQYMNSKMLQIVSFNASTGQLVTKDYTG